MHHLLNRIQLPFQSLYTVQKGLRPSNFFSMQELLSALTASPAAALGSIDCQNSAPANGIEDRVTSFVCRLLYSTFLYAHARLKTTIRQYEMPFNRRFPINVQTKINGAFRSFLSVPQGSVFLECLRTAKPYRK